MNRTALTTRRRLATAAAVALPLLVSGCGFSGFDAQTNTPYQPAVGADVQTGPVAVLGAVIVSPQDGKGAFLATLVDNSDSGDNKLIGITAADGTKVTGLSSPVELPAQQPVNLADTRGIGMSGSNLNTVDSNYVELTLQFSASDPVKVDVPVVPNSGPYADYGVPASSEPSATPLAGD